MTATAFRFFEGLDTLCGSGYLYGEARELPPLTALLDLEEDLDDNQADVAEGAD